MMAVQMSVYRRILKQSITFAVKNFRKAADRFLWRLSYGVLFKYIFPIKSTLLFTKFLEQLNFRTERNVVLLYNSVVLRRVFVLLNRYGPQVF